MGGHSQPNPIIIPSPPVPPNPDTNPALVQQLADIASQRFQTEIFKPGMEQLVESQQARIPLEYGDAGFFPEQQNEFAQLGTSQIQSMYQQPSVSAALASQQSMFQAGLANLSSMQDAAARRAQVQEANYSAYAQAVPQFAMGFSNLFQQGQNQYNTQPQQGLGFNPQAGLGGMTV